MRKIIAISGLAGSGKSTFSEKLQTEMFENNVEYETMSFAERGKELFCEFMGKPYHELFGNEFMKNQNRPKLVDFIEGIKEVFGKSVWANILAHKIDPSSNAVIVIPDLRFHEEYHALKEYGDVVLVQMDRDAVKPKTTIDWYQKGFKTGLLTENQRYQYHNLKQPNPMAQDSPTQGYSVGNDDDPKMLWDVAKGILEREFIITSNKVNENV